MSRTRFLSVFLFGLLLFPFAFSTAQDELYLTSTDRANVFGAFSRKSGPVFRPVAQFSYASTTEGTLSTITRNSSEFYILYPYAVNATKSGIRWDKLNFNEATPQFTFVGSRNFANVNPTSPFFFKAWKYGPNAGIVYVKNNDVVGKRFNVNSGNLFGGNTVLWNNTGSTEVVTGCVDPWGKYMLVINFDTMRGYTGVIEHLNNGHRIGNPVFYRFSGSIIGAECSRTQPDGTDTILFKGVEIQGSTFRTRPFKVEVNATTFGIAQNATPISPANLSTQSFTFFERFNTVAIRYTPNGVIGDYLFGKKSGNDIEPFIRHADSHAFPIGPIRKLYNRNYDTLGMSTILGLGTDH